MTQETYTLEYEVDLLTDNPRSFTYYGLTLNKLIHNLLYLSANNILAFGDALYILDSDNNHIFNSTEFVNENVEFKCRAGSYTFQLTYEQALECLAANSNVPIMTITIKYRPKGTETWETFTND